MADDFCIVPVKDVVFSVDMSHVYDNLLLSMVTPDGERMSVRHDRLAAAPAETSLKS